MLSKTSRKLIFLYFLFLQKDQRYKSEQNEDVLLTPPNLFRTILPNKIYAPCTYPLGQKVN